MRTLALALTLTLWPFVAPLRADGPPPPVQVIANVLALSEGQIGSWIGILDARNTAIQPLQQQLQAKQQAIATLLQSGVADPAAVGGLFIDAHAIELQIAGVVTQANMQFEALLTEDQRTRLHQIRQAAQVCPVVPALQATGLL
jgi:uncharacterized membrane protein